MTGSIIKAGFGSRRLLWLRKILNFMDFVSQCCTALGSFLVPFSYLTVWEMTGSSTAATIAGALVLFDVGFLTLTQYILLDPILLFFISGSIYCSFKFYNYRERSVEFEIEAHISRILSKNDRFSGPSA